MSKGTKPRPHVNDALAGQGFPSSFSVPCDREVVYAAGKVGPKPGELEDDLLDLIEHKLNDYIARNGIPKDHPPLLMKLFSFYEGQEVHVQADQIKDVVERIASLLLSGQTARAVSSTPDLCLTIVGWIDNCINVEYNINNLVSGSGGENWVPLPGLPSEPGDGIQNMVAPSQEPQEELGSLVRELFNEVRMMNRKLDTVMGALETKGVIKTPHPPLEQAERMENIAGLTPKQSAVFQAVEAVPGKDVHARRQVQELLRQLEGEHVTEELVKTFQRILKARGWSVRCNCGASASPLWHRNQPTSTKGSLKFSHPTDTGKFVTHGGLTVFPKVVLMERVDRRKRASA